MTTYLLIIKYSVADGRSTSFFISSDGWWEKPVVLKMLRQKAWQWSKFVLPEPGSWLMQQISTFQKMLHNKNNRELYKIFARMINVGVLCDICFVWQGMLSSDQKRGSAVLPLLPDSCMNEEAKGKNISASRNWLLHNKSRLKDFLLQRVYCLVKICKEFICLFWDQFTLMMDCQGAGSI